MPLANGSLKYLLSSLRLRMPRWNVNRYLKAKVTGDKQSSQVSSRILGENFNSKVFTAAIYDNNLSSTFLTTLAL